MGANGPNVQAGTKRMSCLFVSSTHVVDRTFFFVDSLACVSHHISRERLYCTTHFPPDRNEGKSKVIPEEVEKRRALFWELVYLDARLV